MKPLMLSIEGFKSFAEEQTIDFEKLSQNGIFGIFGNTGSGKSSILDAIVLALYGDVIEKGQTADFINVRSRRARVVFMFAVNRGGKENKYRVERIFKFSKDRTTVGTTATLSELRSDGEYPIEENAQRVTSHIKTEIIGLDKGDFLKCIALPQGDFSAFIKLNRADRIAVISKLFDLDKYGDSLSYKLKALEDKAREDLTSDEGKLIGMGDISPEKTKQDEELLHETESKLNIIKSDSERIRKRLAEAVEIKKLKDEKLGKSKKLQSLYDNKRNIDDINECLVKFDAVQKVQKYLDDFTETEKNVKKTENDIAICERNNNALEQKSQCVKKDMELVPEKQNFIENETARRAKLFAAENDYKAYKEGKSTLNALRDDYKKLTESKKQSDTKLASLVACKKELEQKQQFINMSEMLDNICKIAGNYALSEHAVSELNFLKDVYDKIKDKDYSIAETVSIRLKEIELLCAYLNGDYGEALKQAVEKTAAIIKDDAELTKKAAELDRQIENINGELRLYEEKINSCLSDGKKISERNEEIKKRLDEILCGKEYRSAIDECEESIKKAKEFIEKSTFAEESINKQTQALRYSEAENQVRLSELKNNLSKTLVSIENELNPLGISREEAAKILLKKKEYEQDRLTVKGYESDIKALEIRIGEINGELERIGDTSADYDAIRQDDEKISELLNDINKKYGEISSTYKKELKNLGEWRIINRNIEVTKAKSELYGKLRCLIKSKNFLQFIADEYLRETASVAERRVLELTGGRYGLIYDGEFYVLDNLSGGVKRPVSGLSGGESFLVSLSLALSLSSQICQKALRPIDFFFLDEGFGTLDDDLIDTVMDSLEKLRRSNFTVGLISHVAELKNRIQSRINVTGASADKGTILS